MTREQLFQQFEQMPPEELAEVVEIATAVRSQKVAPVLPAEEAQLLHAINQAMPPGQVKRFRELIERRRQGTLTTAEHDELLALGKEDEQRTIARLEALIRLAQLRATTVEQLMLALHLSPATNGE